jgi:hypothetical protein
VKKTACEMMKLFYLRSCSLCTFDVCLQLLSEQRAHPGPPSREASSSVFPPPGYLLDGRILGASGILGGLAQPHTDRRSSIHAWRLRRVGIEFAAADDPHAVKAPSGLLGSDHRIVS